MNREAIYSPLWARLSALPEFKTKSRRLKHWADVPADDQPALYMAQTGETAQTTTGLETKWTLRLDLYVYVQSGDEAPGPIINPLIDSICNTINAIHPVTGRSILNVPGLEYCRVEGAIDTDEGTLGSQSVAIIPVTILAT